MYVYLRRYLFPALLAVGYSLYSFPCSGGELPIVPPSVDETSEISLIEQQLKSSYKNTDTEKTYENIRKGLAGAAQAGREDIVFKAHMAMAWAAYRFGHYQKSLTSIELAQQMALGNNDWGGLGESYYLKSLVFRELKQDDKMLTAARAAAEYLPDFSSDSIAAEASVHLTDIFYTSGQLLLAYEMALKGLSVIPNPNPDLNRAILSNYLGMVCDEWGILLPALSFYQQSLTEAARLNDSLRLSVVYNNIGLLYKKLKRYDEALDYLGKSLLIDQKLKNETGMAEVYSNLGIIWTCMKQFDKAGDAFEKSFSLVKKTSDSSFYSLIYNNMGDLYLEMGKLKVALTYARKSVEIDRRAGNQADLSTSLQTRGKILAGLGFYKQAMTDYQESEQLCIQNRYNEDLSALYLDMAELYYLTGRSDYAYDYLKRSNAMRDSVFNVRLMNQSLYITVEKNLAEKQREIDKLKADRLINMQQIDEKQHLIRRQRWFQYALLFAVVVAIVASIMLFRLLRKNKMVNIKLRLQNVDMEHQKTRLLEAIEKSKEADRLKENFLATMNHELRTPLNGIIGFAEIIENEASDELHVEMARSINQSGTRLMTTLNSLLNLSQIERNMVEVSYSIFSITELTSMMVEKYRDEARQKSLYLSIDLPDKPIRVSSDEVLVGRVIENLLDNAVKYTLSGGVKVSVRGDESTAGYRVMLDVSDTGIGISSEHLETIFQQFRQVSEGLIRDFEGAGVGLSLCRSYLVLLGGDLKVSSTLGAGTTFSVVLPALWEETEYPIARFANRFALDEKGMEAMSSDMKKVLLVEDDDINREFALYTLAGIYDVAVATTAQKALSLASKTIFDAVLLDINIGRDVTGLDVLKDLRMMLGYSAIPVAAVTANTLRGDRDRLLAGGFNYYLPKPYSRKELIALIDAMLSNTSSDNNN